MECQVRCVKINFFKKKLPDTTRLLLIREPPQICSYELSAFLLYIPTCHGNNPSFASNPFTISVLPCEMGIPHSGREQQVKLEAQWGRRL